MFDISSGRLAPLHEYLTFGRPPLMLVRVWIIQVVLVFADVGVFRVLHPWFTRVVRTPLVSKIYLGVTVVAFVVLYAFLRWMGNRTFDPRFHRAPHIAISVVFYLLLGGSVVAIVALLPAPTLQPNVHGGFQPIEIALGVMMSVNLSAFFAVGFFAQTNWDSFPTKHEVDETIEEWLDALDWTGRPEGSREKESRYNEFQRRTKAVTELLENSYTERGSELHADFEAWVSWLEKHGPLSQEAVLEREVKNERLRRQRGRLRTMIDQLEDIVDDQ